MRPAAVRVLLAVLLLSLLATAINALKRSDWLLVALCGIVGAVGFVKLVGTFRETQDRRNDASEPNSPRLK